MNEQREFVRCTVEFLRARLDEDERDAREGVEDYAEMGEESRERLFSQDLNEGALYWYASRTAREVAAKRELLEQFGSIDHWKDWSEVTSSLAVLSILTSIYSDHPDYDPAWAAPFEWTTP